MLVKILWHAINKTLMLNFVKKNVGSNRKIGLFGVSETHNFFLALSMKHLLSSFCTGVCCNNELVWIFSVTFPSTIIFDDSRKIYKNMNFSLYNHKWTLLLTSVNKSHVKCFITVYSIVKIKNFLVQEMTIYQIFFIHVQVQASMVNTSFLISQYSCKTKTIPAISYLKKKKTTCQENRQKTMKYIFFMFSFLIVKLRPQFFCLLTWQHPLSNHYWWK